MIYVPNPKALVYSELQFISTSGPVPQPKLTMDSIMDEVSVEIHALFVPPSVEVQQSASLLNNVCDALWFSEVLN